MTDFEKEVKDRLVRVPDETELCNAAKKFMAESTIPKYSYNYFWLGRPIIQYPQDIVAMQELIWEVKPDLIIETGIAHGGSLILYASMLAQLDMIDAIENGVTINPNVSERKVLGIDIDIRGHNRIAIEGHPMSSRIQMIQGSSIDQDIIDQVKGIVNNYKKIIVCLDSNHTHAHVLAELEAYAPLTSVGSYCVVFDTIIEELPGDMYPDRLWSKGDNPKTAVHEYLQKMKTKEGKGPVEFEIDKEIDNKLLISVAPSGYLKRTG